MSVRRTLHIAVATFLIVALFSVRLFALPALAAQTTIDNTVHATGASHLHSGPTSVFTSDQNGYKFYRDSSGECSYATTTTGGTSWGTPILVDDRGPSTDCLAIAVWYDQWTPNATSGQQYVHVATMSSKDVQYNRLDTTNNTLLTGSTATSASTSTLQIATFVLGANYPSITTGTDGTVYISADDTSDSFVVECTTNCDLPASWSNTGTVPQDLANDYSVLTPLTDGDIMLINRDISAEDIRSKLWDNSAGIWKVAWTPIDTNATDNTTYDVGLAVVVASSTSAATTTTFLVYMADNAGLGTDDDIRTARYENGNWATSTTAGTTTAYVVTDDAKGLTGVALGLDKTTNDVYVAYSGRTTPGTAATGHVYWKKSINKMESWGSEQGPISTTTDDILGVDINGVSDERLFVSWFINTADDLMGDTIADLTPPGGGGGDTTDTTKSVQVIDAYIILRDTDLYIIN